MKLLSSERDGLPQRSITFFLFAFCIKMQLVNSISDVGDNITESNAVTYLMKFGYLPDQKQVSALITRSSLSQAIAEFQSFSGLNETGILDKDTLELMSLPRCGMKDSEKFDFNVRDGIRKKRYVIQGSRWRLNNLKYKITTYPQRVNIDKSVVDKEIARAFSVWSKYAPLIFQQVQNGRADIEIKFLRLFHDHCTSFDGPGGVLAHASYPQADGFIHFDDDENWTVNSYYGTNLFQVAAHEIGHTLGLQHSGSNGLMAPYYRQYDPNFQLHPDDIRGIQAIYGANPSPPNNPVVTTPASRPTPVPASTPAPPTKKGSAPLPDLCAASKIDAVLNIGTDIVFFIGDYYWKMVNGKSIDRYPQRISDTWPGLPGNVDAAFNLLNIYTFFFKGSKFWRYTGNRMDDYYPREISTTFPGIPNDINAATVQPLNGLIFFFKDSSSYGFNWMIGRVGVGPIPIFAMYRNHVNGVDAAYSTYDRHVFFKDSEYTVYDKRSLTVVQKGSIKTDLFGCPKN